MKKSALLLVLVLAVSALAAENAMTSFLELKAQNFWPKVKETTHLAFRTPHPSWHGCWGTGDPHVVDFQRRNIELQGNHENQYLAVPTGDKVHSETRMHWGIGPSTNIAVAFESAGSVWAIALNPARHWWPEVYFNGVKKTNYFSGAVQRRLNHFSIKRLYHSGSTAGYSVTSDNEVSLTVHAWGYGSWGHISTYVYVHPKYFGRTRGICGNWGHPCGSFYRPTNPLQSNARCGPFWNPCWAPQLWINGACRASPRLEPYTMPVGSPRSLFRFRHPLPPPPPPTPTPPPAEPTIRIKKMCSKLTKGASAQEYKDCIVDATTEKKTNAVVEATVGRIAARAAELKALVALRRKFPKRLRVFAPQPFAQTWQTCGSWGDPHVINFRRVAQDLHYPGELVMFSDLTPNGDRVHVVHKTGPRTHGRPPAYNIKSGIFSKGHRITFGFDKPWGRTGKLALRYNGRRIKLVVPRGRKPTFPTLRRFGPFVVRSGPRYVDVLSDNDVNMRSVALWHHGSHYLDVTVRVRKTKGRKAGGTCGNFRGQYVSRKGRVGPLWLVGPSWRARRPETLWPRIRDAPRPPVRHVKVRIPRAKRRRAYRLCLRTLRFRRPVRGRRNKALMRDCINDVVFLGNEAAQETRAIIYEERFAQKPEVRPRESRIRHRRYRRYRRYRSRRARRYRRRCACRSRVRRPRGGNKCTCNIMSKLLKFLIVRRARGRGRGRGRRVRRIRRARRARRLRR